MCSKDLRIPARSILELSRMLQSHRPLFRTPSRTSSILSFLPLSLRFLSFQVVNMPHPHDPVRICSSQKESSSSSNATPTEGVSLPFSSKGFRRASVFSPFLFPSVTLYVMRLSYGLRNQGFFEKPKVVLTCRCVCVCVGFPLKVALARGTRVLFESTLSKSHLFLRFDNFRG